MGSFNDFVIQPSSQRVDFNGASNLMLNFSKTI